MSGHWWREGCVSAAAIVMFFTPRHVLSPCFPRGSWWKRTCFRTDDIVEFAKTASSSQPSGHWSQCEVISQCTSVYPTIPSIFCYPPIPWSHRVWAWILPAGNHLGTHNLIPKFFLQSFWCVAVLQVDWLLTLPLRSNGTDPVKHGALPPFLHGKYCIQIKSNVILF